MIRFSENEVRLSVRQLVEFMCRSGSIDVRETTGILDVSRMQTGARIHRKLQKEAKGLYTPEVPVNFSRDLSCLISRPDETMEVTYAYSLIIEGRADGVIEDEDGFMIDEIKTVSRDVLKMEEPEEVHLAQAKVYAAVIAKQQSLESIRVQMTYVEPDSMHIKRFESKYTTEELSAWLEELLSRFKVWTDFGIRQRMMRQASIQGLPFPYPYREGQRDLVVCVYRHIEAGKRLFIQAPTGTGKTLAAVYPAVQSVGQSQAERIFYLTAKTITRTVAEEAFDLLREKGLHFRTVTLTAKEKICPQEDKTCSPETCPYAKGHFDRINEALFDLISHEERITRPVVLQYADRHTVCPYSLAMEAADWSDGIIGDYNYGFDPEASLMRFFVDASGSSIFLIDEAHNLVDRARGMYSAEISKEEVLAERRIFRKLPGSSRVCKALSAVNDWLLAAGKQAESGGEGIARAEGDDSSVFSDLVLELDGALLSYLNHHRKFEGRDEILLFFFGVHHFIGMAPDFETGYLLYTSKGESGTIFHAFCVDPSAQLIQRMDCTRSTILFSATLLPIQYFKEMLTGQTDDDAVYAHSIFSSEARHVYIARDVSSRYRERSQDGYGRIAKYIRETVQAKSGHYMVYFPSYAFLTAVAEVYSRRFPDDTLLIQDRNMSEADREEFLAAFRHPDGTTRIGFCVMGGAFAEGIDLKNESLIGAIIVGTGLPGISMENELLRRYFDERGKDGFSYAYRYPGMNNVLQAAGRVIRTRDDRGVIVLLDRRFLGTDYRALFPREWDRVSRVDIGSAGEALRQFWDGK
ncbi:MAG: ATP-dependent DNA helicase [Lachnospiraceae bacterium]|jgi:DNA excision repair protein ERCC-2